MPGLKLGKLPDRVPIKITIAVAPDLKEALDDYTSLYGRTYGIQETLIDLIPAMLEAFLQSDRAFQKGRSSLHSDGG